MDCYLHGDLVLEGDASLEVTAGELSIAGNLTVSGQAKLRIIVERLLFAQHSTSQYTITLAGSARLELIDARVDTNEGEAGNLFMSLEAYDDSEVRFVRTSLDQSRSWILGSFHDRSALRNEDAASCPTEVYPSDSSTISVRGAHSSTGIWLAVPPRGSAVAADLPGVRPFSYRFGRGVPGSSGIDYLVRIDEGNAGLGFTSTPYSELTVRDNQAPTTISYIFAATSTAQAVSGLHPAGPQDLVLGHQGRRLVLDHALLNIVGWQLYADNSGVGSPAPITISDSVINELGALNHGLFVVRNVVFQFALIDAAGPASRIDITGSVINSQTIHAQADGVISIAQSSIFGSLIEATGQARIRLADTELHPNVCHPGCLPRCVSLNGGGECNGFNPAHDVRFAATEQAAILAARIAPIAAPLTRGSTLALTGDALSRSAVPAIAAATYRLSYRATSDQGLTPIASGPAEVLDGTLGVLDTRGAEPGSYELVLELDASGEPPLIVRRSFTILR